MSEVSCSSMSRKDQKAILDLVELKQESDNSIIKLKIRTGSLICENEVTFVCRKY